VWAFLGNSLAPNLVEVQVPLGDEGKQVFWVSAAEGGEDKSPWNRERPSESFWTVD